MHINFHKYYPHTLIDPKEHTFFQVEKTTNVIINFNQSNLIPKEKGQTLEKDSHVPDIKSLSLTTEAIIAPFNHKTTNPL